MYKRELGVITVTARLVHDVRMVCNFHGVLIFVIFVVNSEVTKISPYEN